MESNQELSGYPPDIKATRFALIAQKAIVLRQIDRKWTLSAAATILPHGTKVREGNQCLLRSQRVEGT